MNPARLRGRGGVVLIYSQTPAWTTGLFRPGAESQATGAPTALCPDLLCYEQIGAADGWRGRVIRGVFWVLQLWPPRPPGPRRRAKESKAQRPSRAQDPWGTGG